MKKLALILPVLMLAVGCANKNAAPKNKAVVDISPAPVAPHEPQVYGSPVAVAPAQPAPGFYDAAAVSQTPAPAAPAAGAASGSYTVKKGDTLFSIAKTSYGNGNQWQRIAAANPGVSPGSLKAGQRIVIP
jgi:5'-nucleotidase